MKYLLLSMERRCCRQKAQCTDHSCAVRRTSFKIPMGLYQFHGNFVVPLTGLEPVRFQGEGF